jgi:hypothetical protein
MYIKDFFRGPFSSVLAPCFVQRRRMYAYKGFLQCISGPFSYSIAVLNKKDVCVYTKDFFRGPFSYSIAVLAPCFVQRRRMYAYKRISSMHHRTI